MSVGLKENPSENTCFPLTQNPLTSINQTASPGFACSLTVGDQVADPVGNGLTGLLEMAQIPSHPGFIGIVQRRCLAGRKAI